MWLLWFTLTVSGVTYHTPLQRFDTLQACHISREQAAVGMQEAYPVAFVTEHYTFECLRAEAS